MDELKIGREAGSGARAALCLAALCLAAAGPAMAEDGDSGEVGVPAGCEIAATLVMKNCVMKQVLACEGDGPVRVDIYNDGVFLGEDAYAANAMVNWRRGLLVQELKLLEGSFEWVPSMPEDEVIEVRVDRIRRKMGSDDDPMSQQIDYRIEVVGPEIRTLASGKTREIRRYHVTTATDGPEATDMQVDYDPALGVPIWTEGSAIAHDGSVHEISVGVADVLMPDDPGYMQARAPEDAPCTPG